jgi:hypothetical protein
MADLTKLAKEIMARKSSGKAFRELRSLARRLIALEAENAELRSSAPFDYLFAVRSIVDPAKPERMMLNQIAPAVEHLRRDADESAANLMQWLATGTPTAYEILRTFAKRQGYELSAEDPVAKLRETMERLPRDGDGNPICPGAELWTLDGTNIAVGCVDADSLGTGIVHVGYADWRRYGDNEWDEEASELFGTKEAAQAAKGANGNER